MCAKKGFEQRTQKHRLCSTQCVLEKKQMGRRHSYVNREIQICELVKFDQN